MELKVTSEKVKEAAASCPQADAVLRKLFPEVFVVDLNRYHRKAMMSRVGPPRNAVGLTREIATALLKDNYKGAGYTVSDFPFVILDECGGVNGFATEESLLKNWTLK